MNTALCKKMNTAFNSTPPVVPTCCSLPPCFASTKWWCLGAAGLMHGGLEAQYVQFTRTGSYSSRLR